MENSVDGIREIDLQAWRDEAFGLANDLCARAAVIIDFFASCKDHFEAHAPARLALRDKAIAEHPVFSVVASLTERVDAKKVVSFGVNAAEQSVRAAALNFLQVALEETIHACLNWAVRLEREKVLQRLPQSKVQLDDPENIETEASRDKAIESWLASRLRESLPKKLELLNWLLPPDPETSVDASFVADLNEARHDAIHRGGRKEAATFPLVSGHVAAFGSCAILIDKVLDRALPEGWRDREEGISKQ